jgi:hypothetical protein
MVSVSNCRIISQSTKRNLFSNHRYFHGDCAKTEFHREGENRNRGRNFFVEESQSVSFGQYIHMINPVSQLTEIKVNDMIYHDFYMLSKYY